MGQKPAIEASRVNTQSMDRLRRTTVGGFDTFPKRFIGVHLTVVRLFQDETGQVLTVEDPMSSAL